MNKKGTRIRQYFDIEALVLLKRFKIFETLLPAGTRKGSSHSPEEGRFAESLLRDFLARHLPEELKVFSGFILKPWTKIGKRNLSRLALDEDEQSTQIDIIVYDSAHFPIFERFQEFAIVPPEGVVGIISVKKSLRIGSLKNELKALEHAAKLCFNADQRGPHLGIFAFTSAENQTDMGAAIYRQLSKHLKNTHFNFAVNEVSVLDKGLIFKYRPEDSTSNTAKYVYMDTVDIENRGHIVVQRLIQSIMSVYYDRNKSGYDQRPGFVSFEKGTFANGTHKGDLPITYNWSSPTNKND